MKISKVGSLILKIILTVLITFVTIYSSLYILIILSMVANLNPIICFLAMLVIPLLLLIVWWKSKRKKLFKLWILYVVLLAVAGGINYGIVEYKESLRIKTDININVYEYMPFDNNSKIVTLEKESSLKLFENLPRLDGAAAVFPLYSAFVNAVYPNDVKYGSEAFQYNNTVRGYKMLAEKRQIYSLEHIHQKNRLNMLKRMKQNLNILRLEKKDSYFL